MGPELPLPPATGLLDVYIVGGHALEPTAQMKVAALIASRYRVGAGAVADGLSGGQCLVGARLTDPAARKLAEELADLGAETKLQPAGVPLRLTVKRSAQGGGSRAERGTSIDRSPVTSGVMEVVQMGERIETAVRERAARGAAAAEQSAPDSVRCALHGLYYDRTRASGCSRCLQQARVVARQMEESAPVGRWVKLRRDPVRRAFFGLALALVVGFVPAAYSAWGIDGPEVARLRDRQVALSRQPATQALTAEFDTLDAAVYSVRRKGITRTAAIWLMVTALVGVGWYKLGASREGATDDDDHG
jgi:hypothetical protein